MKKTRRKVNNQSGAAMLISVLFFLFISLAIIAGLVGPTVREFRNARVNLNSKLVYFLAESGTEDAAYRILNNMTIGNSETITLNSNSVTTTISTLLGNIKEVDSLGDVESSQRKTSLTLKTGEGTVFKYGSQAGEGGFVFQNNSYVSGSLYSNGDILGSNGAYVTGDAFVAGNTGLISNMRIGYGGTGNAHSHNVTGSTVTGTIYCQVGSGNNKNCDTSQADPEIKEMPISDEKITQWKTDATNGGVTENNVIISTPTFLGPQKIIGNLTINDILTITDTIYVTGNIIINAIPGQPTPPSLKLTSSYGATSGIIIADGYIIINNGVAFEDSGTTGSYILLLSNSTCDASMSGSPCNGHNAIDVSNNSAISILNAQKGTIYFSNNASVKEAAGKKIELKNNTHFDYGSGLINVDFTSGPSGSWVIDSWEESI
ncbi:MAG: hypothetical protein WC694_02870 [Candidatus Paceibacterota bacterium]|jgi:hypothetical protein